MSCSAWRNGQRSNAADIDAAVRAAQGGLQRHWRELSATERGRLREIEEAAHDIEGVADEGLTWRLRKATEARAEAQRGPQDKSGESVIAPNGVALDKDELEEQRRIFGSIRFEKGKNRP